MTTATASPPISRRRPSLRSVEDRNAMVTANINLVYGYLHRRWPRYATDDDVIQAGRVGLIRAAELYDPEKLNRKTGLRYEFSTYAEWWMRQTVTAELESRRAAYMASLTSDDDDRQRCDPPAREVSAEEQIAIEQRWAAVEAKLTWAMERMGRAARRYLQAKCLERLTLREIAEAQGVSRVRVKQMQEAVLAKMERVLRERGLFDGEGG